MYSDIIVKSLKMGVDPADNSYMPSVIIISGGSSVSALTELNVVYVRNIDTVVTLLSNMEQHYPLIEICIIKCKNRGIDCKVHGLAVVGFKKSNYNELKTSVSFLANDWDLSQDHITPIHYSGILLILRIKHFFKIYY